LDRAAIAWYVNGTLVAEGEGVKTALAETGALGTRTVVTVEATIDGALLTATRAITPAEVDVLWEGTSYTPPLYKGRTLATFGSGVRVEALPRLVRLDGTSVPARDIVFSWRKNGVVLTDVSGRGKSSLVLGGPELFGADTISVEAASLDQTLIASAETIVPSTNPFVLLYEDHPLFGVTYHRALDPETTFSDVEATLVAAPYFAAVRSPNDPRLSYEWRVNGATISPDEKEPSRITINAGNSDGRARLELSVTHALDFLMDAKGLWRLVFGKSLGQDVNLFGAPPTP
jgi:hypothetical protein